MPSTWYYTFDGAEQFTATAGGIERSGHHRGLDVTHAPVAVTLPMADHGTCPRRAIASALLSLLEPHVAREKGALFPELAEAGASHHVRRLEDQHAELDLALRPIAGNMASASEWAALPRAIDELRHHIWTEEFDVFPAALQLLDPPAWQRVEDGCRPSPPSPPTRL
jgi:hypothetical protein